MTLKRMVKTKGTLTYGAWLEKNYGIKYSDVVTFSKSSQKELEKRYMEYRMVVENR